MRAPLCRQILTTGLLATAFVAGLSSSILASWQVEYAAARHAAERTAQTHLPEQVVWLGRFGPWALPGVDHDGPNGLPGEPVRGDSGEPQGAWLGVPPAPDWYRLDRTPVYPALVFLACIRGDDPAHTLPRPVLPRPADPPVDALDPCVLGGRLHQPHGPPVLS